jgi:MFS family permease
VNDEFHPAPPVRRLPLALLAAFFLSGGVALIYQVLWTRRLGLIFGVTIQAASTVLACFMAGLALGSYIAGRRSDRLANPLRTFAWVRVPHRRLRC